MACSQRIYYMWPNFQYAALLLALVMGFITQRAGIVIVYVTTHCPTSRKLVLIVAVRPDNRLVI